MNGISLTNGMRMSGIKVSVSNAMKAADSPTKADAVGVMTDT